MEETESWILLLWLFTGLRGAASSLPVPLQEAALVSPQLEALW